MADLLRMRCVWGGSGVVGAGLTTFHFATTASGMNANVHTFFEALKSAIPTSVNVIVPNTGDVIDVLSGTLTGSWTDGSSAQTTTGTSSLAFGAGVGIRIKWPTSGIHHGRRVVGSTFIVPTVGAAFDTDGTLTSATRTQFENAAAALLTAQPELRVWSRPGVTNDGQASTVTSSVVPDTVSWLRSRRT